ncbi:hypothetical protein Tco_1249137 [Tanacetum coccineum]
MDVSLWTHLSRWGTRVLLSSLYKARPLLSHALETDDFKGLVDPRLGTNFVASEMFRMIEAATACVRHSATKRPRTGHVFFVRKLEFDRSLLDIVGCKQHRELTREVVRKSLPRTTILDAVKEGTGENTEVVYEENPTIGSLFAQDFFYEGRRRQDENPIVYVPDAPNGKRAACTDEIIHKQIVKLKEFSLRRCHPSSSVNQFSDDRHRLKQSNVLAFSRYINKMQPPLTPGSASICNQQKECETNSERPF